LATTAVLAGTLIAGTALPASAASVRPQPPVQTEMQQQREPGLIDRVVRAFHRVMHVVALDLDQPTNPHP
ncbi:MAG: hypothetical protein JWN02_1004, partial [Acidobacteria bacterium]|nr:hypothetical protein [Acidobacteriota bacterium]